MTGYTLRIELYSGGTQRKKMLIIILVPATLVVIAIMLGKVAELERQEVESEEQRKAEAATRTLGHVTR
jgi:hypothetical protein